MSFIHKVVEKGLVTRGRNMKFKTPMLDVPGSLEKIAGILHESMPISSKCGMTAFQRI